MRKRFDEVGRESGIEVLFAGRKALPCSAGRTLLRSFALARPADFAFLKPEDLTDLNNSAFADISEWEAFATHYESCELCHA